MNESARSLEAAITGFSRYGVRKATMGDIAEVVGISRQTLYASYADKGEALTAAICFPADTVIAEVTEACADAGSIGEKLDIFLNCAVVRCFEQIKQMPDSNDLLSGHGESGATGLQIAEQGKLELQGDLFTAKEAALAANGANPADLAEFFYNSASNFKYTARDAGHPNRLLATLKQATMVMLGEG